MKDSNSKVEAVAPKSRNKKRMKIVDLSQRYEELVESMGGKYLSFFDETTIHIIEKPESKPK